MRELIIFLANFIFLSSITYGQNFEGEVIYANTFTSKMPGISDNKLASIIGSKQEYYIKNERYKSVTDGMITFQLYDKITNRVYNKANNSDTLYWFSATINTDEVMEYEIKNNQAEILGKPCSALVAKTKTGVTTYYYNNEYKVDSAAYKEHNYGNWAFFVLKTGALPLKTVIENDQFRMESTAVEVKPIKLQDNFFEIKSGTPIKQGK
jgi:hypothetical protein